MSEHANAVQATNREQCPTCGFWGRTDGPLSEEHLQVHSCINYLKELLKEERSVCQINHEAAERCAGERDRAIEFARQVENENGMLDFDLTTARVQRDNAQHWLEAAKKDVEFYKMEYQRARDCLTKFRKVIGFFRSVIKSGEGWTHRCERELSEATDEFLKLREKIPTDPKERQQD